LTVDLVVFDVGETLVDETRAWGVWADHFGVPRLTFFAALGAVIERGGDHREVFETFRPGIDLNAESRQLGVDGRSDLVSVDDLYPDVLDVLRVLRASGIRLAVAANQPAPAADVVAEMGVDFEFIGTSEDWSVAKPDPAFFERIIAEAGLPPRSIAYVGDRVDNDVRPAAAAGLTAVFLRRGPWAWIQAGGTDPDDAAVTITSLSGLPDALVRLSETR
jgi:FMN phosphatase YigB (HAD superfamily)